MAAPAIDPGVSLIPPNLAGLRIDLVAQDERFRKLDKLDAYAKATQYNARQYNWDGHLLARLEGDADIDMGIYIPMKRRRPSARVDLPKLITKRLTAMVFSEERWPELSVDGDPDAEDYLKALANVCNMQVKMQEARDYGGACGTACMSFSFVDGAPRVAVHRAKHMKVLRWADRDELVIGAVLKVYRYERQVWDQGKPKLAAFYFARYWDEQREIVWDPIPESEARNGAWHRSVKSYTVVHGYGECPVYWAQNVPDSENEDGASDFEGSLELFDAVNSLVSSTFKGTVGNVDPTLIIKDDPGQNPGVVRKGSDNAIFSKNGAEYLELKGDAVKAANELAAKLIQYSLDVAGVVLGDPEKLSGAAQSAAALRILYLPMINSADILRTQYGKVLLVRLLVGMLRACKKIVQTPEGPIQITADGRRIQEKPVVVLPLKIETTKGTDGNPSVSKKVRNPGDLEFVSLRCPPYFKSTAQDTTQAVDAATKAQGKVISDRTAVKFTAGEFGVTDVEQELVDIEAERAVRMQEQIDQNTAINGGLDNPGGGRDVRGDDADE